MLTGHSVPPAPTFVLIVWESPRLYVVGGSLSILRYNEGTSLPPSTLAQVISVTQEQTKQPVHLVTPAKAGPIILQAQLSPYNFLCLWCSPPISSKLPRKGSRFISWSSSNKYKLELLSQVTERPTLHTASMLSQYESVHLNCFSQRNCLQRVFHGNGTDFTQYFLL